MRQILACLRRLALVTAGLLFVLQAAAAEAGTSFDLSAHAGKVVVVDFWASWCVPCRRSFPWLNHMHDKYGDDGLVIIGGNLDATRAEAEGFLGEYPARFAIHYDDSKSLAKEFEVIAMLDGYGAEAFLAAQGVQYWCDRGP